jgi:hypothetical protein
MSLRSQGEPGGCAATPTLPAGKLIKRINGAGPVIGLERVRLTQGALLAANRASPSGLANPGEPTSPSDSAEPGCFHETE